MGILLVLSVPYIFATAQHREYELLSQIDIHGFHHYNINLSCQTGHYVEIIIRTIPFNYRIVYNK